MSCGSLFAAARGLLIVAVVLVAVPSSARCQSGDPIGDLTRRYDALAAVERWDEALRIAEQILTTRSAQPNVAAIDKARDLIRSAQAIESGVNIGMVGLGNHLKAADLVEQALTFLEPQTAGADPIEIASYRYLLADAYDNAGKPCKAEPHARSAYDIYEQRDPGSRQAANAATRVAVIERALATDQCAAGRSTPQERFERSERLVDQALAVLRRFGEDDLDYAASLFVKAGIARDNERLVDALATYRLVAAIRERKRTPESPQRELDLSHTFAQLAEVSVKLDRVDDEVMRNIDSALEIRRRFNGPDSNAVALAYTIRATAHVGRRDAGRALSDLYEAIAVYDPLQGGGAHKKQAGAMTRLANAFSERGFYSEAERLHRDARDIRLAYEPSQAAINILGIAAALRAQGRLVDALKEARLARDHIKREYRPLIASANLVLGGILTDLGKPGEAETLLMETLDIRRKERGAGSEEASTALNLLGYVQRVDRKYAAARASYEEALRIRQQLKAAPETIAALHSNIGGLERARYYNHEAETHYLRALEDYAKGRSATAAQITTLLNLALLNDEQGRYQDALARVEAARVHARAASNAPAGRLPEIEVRMAALLVKLERPGEASALLDRYLSPRGDASVPEHLLAATAHEVYADLHRRKATSAGYAAAIEHLHQAYGLRTGKLSDGRHPTIAANLYVTSEAHRQAGDGQKHAEVEARWKLIARGTRQLKILFGTNRAPDRGGCRGGTPAFTNNVGKGLLVGSYGATVTPVAAGRTSMDFGADKSIETVAEYPRTAVVGINCEQATTDAAHVAAIANESIGREGKLRGQVVVFVHGYSVGFDDAVKFLAQLGWQLDLSGGLFVYSWPTQGRKWLYRSDQGRAERSVEKLVQFFERVVAQTRADKVHIIAHSMGSRVLMPAIQRLADRSRVKITLGQVVLAAPEVDIATMQAAVMARQSG